MQIFVQFQVCRQQVWSHILNNHFYSKVVFEIFCLSITQNSSEFADVLYHLDLTLDNTNSITSHISRDDPCGTVAVSGAVRWAVGCRESHWTAIDWRNRLFCYCIETENIEDSEERSASECFVRMRSGWVVATCHTPRNLAQAHISHS